MFGFPAQMSEVGSLSYLNPISGGRCDTNTRKAPTLTLYKYLRKVVSKVLKYSEFGRRRKEWSHYDAVRDLRQGLGAK